MARFFLVLDSTPGWWWEPFGKKLVSNGEWLCTVVLKTSKSASALGNGVSSSPGLKYSPKTGHRCRAGVAESAGVLVAEGWGVEAIAPG